MSQRPAQRLNRPKAQRSGEALCETDRDGLYRAIFSRRDVRSQFLPEPVTPDVLARILTAAHFAPSVGLMQPWNFIVIQTLARKRQIHDLFQDANSEAAALFEGERRQKYRDMKLAGILDAPINLCITCNHDRAGPVVLGRTHIKETDIYSTVCAVQNLWLAARAEGIGIGWVSIIDPAALSKTLDLPEHVTPIAYLCLGHVSEFLSQPELQQKGWENRLPLDEVIMFENWRGAAQEHPLLPEARTAQAAMPKKYVWQDDRDDNFKASKASRGSQRRRE